MLLLDGDTIHALHQAITQTNNSAILFANYLDPIVSLEPFLLKDNRGRCLSANLETTVVKIVICQDALHWSINDTIEDMILISPSDNMEVCVSASINEELYLVDCDTHDW